MWKQQQTHLFPSIFQTIQNNAYTHQSRTANTLTLLSKRKPKKKNRFEWGFEKGVDTRKTPRFFPNQACRRSGEPMCMCVISEQTHMWSEDKHICDQRKTNIWEKPRSSAPCSQTSQPARQTTNVCFSASFQPPVAFLCLSKRNDRCFVKKTNKTKQTINLYGISQPFLSILLNPLSQHSRQSELDLERECSCLTALWGEKAHNDESSRSWEKATSSNTCIFASPAEKTISFCHGKEKNHHVSFDVCWVFAPHLWESFRAAVSFCDCFLRTQRRPTEAIIWDKASSSEVNFA